MNTPSLPASGHGEVAGLVDELRAGLEGVTPGPWYVGEHVGGRPRYWIVTNPDTWVHRVAAVPDYQDMPSEIDAAHIARCSPDNIAKLLDHIDALTAQLSAPTPSPVEGRADGAESAITDGMIAAWQSQRGEGMISAVGEYTPSEFWDLLDEVVRLRAALESTPAQPVRESTVEVSVSDLDEWRREWLAENDPRDGTDCVTPFDHYLYRTPLPVCETCDGRREIGCFDRGDNAYRTEPCPDCAQPVREAQEGKAGKDWRELIQLRVMALEQAPRSAKKDFAIEELAFILKHASQPDPAAEIARLTRERDAALDREHNAHLAVKEERAIAERAESELAGEQAISAGLQKLLPETQVINGELTGKIAVIREALEPFSRAAGIWENCGDDSDLWGRTLHLEERIRAGLTVGDLRRARDLLAALESTPAQPVRVGQTELDEIDAAIGATGLIIQGLGSRTIVPVAVVSRLLEIARASLASQPDPAAEIAEAVAADRKRVVDRINELLPHYQSQTATDAGRRQILEYLAKYVDEVTGE